MTASRPQSQRIKDSQLSEFIAILHIEDSEADAHLITEKLYRDNRTKYRVDNAKSLVEANRKLGRQHYDIIFLDLSLPDSIGLKTISEIRLVDKSTPIIVLTGNTDDDVENNIIKYGAQDFIDKNEFNIKLVGRSIRYAIERKKTETQIQDIIQRDELTKLLNRSLFMDRLKHALLISKRTKPASKLAVLMLDIDNFKYINDTLGHSVGDALLIQVANRLRNCIRETDTIARFGSDEFTILFESVEKLDKIGLLANKILSSLAEPFLIDNKPIFTSASIGVSSSIDEKNADAESMLKNADIAMSTAKKKGGNQTGYFTRDLQVTVQIRNNLEVSLRKAIEHNQLKLYFQPQIHLQTGELCGAEALVRWQHPQYGLIPPDGFIPALEETGLIVPATEWIINKGLGLWQQWLQEKIISEKTHLGINISPKFIRHYRTCQTIEGICNQFSVNRQQVIFELTENALIDITPKNINILNSLGECGFRLAIDDFGTGYSSLSYLKAFPIDCIKLDRLFVKDIINSPKDIAIAEAMIQLCKRLDIELVAEGVDNWEKLLLLKNMGCKTIQGYFFSKPLPDNEFQNYVTSFKGSNFLTMNS